MIKLENIKISRNLIYLFICSFFVIAFYPLNTIYANNASQRSFFCSADQDDNYNYRVIWSEVVALPSDGSYIGTQGDKISKSFESALESKGVPIRGARCWHNELYQDLESRRKLEIEDYSKRYAASEFIGWHPSKPGSGSIVSVGTMAAGQAVPVAASGNEASIIVRELDKPAVATPAAKPALKPAPAAKPADKPALPAKKKWTGCGRKGQPNCRAKPM